MMMRKLFYFLSKTDEGIINVCPASTKNIHSTLGFFVLLTGVLALLSGTYAISSMFVHEDPVTGKPTLSDSGIVLSIIGGCIYSAFIMAIDREIVSAHSKWSVVFRIPLAIIISLVISVPVELRIFDSRITKRLLIDARGERDELKSKTNGEQDIQKIKREIDTLERYRRSATLESKYWSEMMEAEVVGRKLRGRTGLSGPGDAYMQAKRIKEDRDTEIIGYDSSIRIKKAELSSAVNRADSSFSKDRVAQSFDLLSRSIALKELKMEDKTKTVKQMSFWITLLFLMFELIPSLMKLMLPPTEYDALLDKRRRLNRYATQLIFEQVSNEYEDMSADEIRDYNPLAVKKLYDAQAR